VEEPKLWKEIGDVAWLMTKIVGGVAILVAVFFFAFRHHPLIGVCVFYALVLIGQVIYAGHQSYRWKKADFKRQCENQERDRQWEEARKRRGEEKSA
jgi:fatty acid desaturase